MHLWHKYDSEDGRDRIGVYGLVGSWATEIDLFK